eukprot:m.105941 g.105941  ORF g.105941 m.105941 type:complete len:124 (-) comp51666_c0_seq1:390-761(-)
MGGSQSVFSGYELAELEYCTFFSQAEIIHIHKEFDRLAKKFDKTADQILTMDQVLSLPVLRFNPFASRICMVSMLFSFLPVIGDARWYFRSFGFHQFFSFCFLSLRSICRCLLKLSVSATDVL